jgi:hypothetical protein
MKKWVELSLIFIEIYIFNEQTLVEPQKGVLREGEGMGLKILSAGRDGTPAKKMHSRNSRTVEILSH